MAIGEPKAANSFVDPNNWTSGGEVTRKVVTEREYNEEGNLVRETVTETTTTTTPNYQYPTISY